jgi:ubiquinone/menaquinone biosynthesis C-methylase UbiE
MKPVIDPEEVEVCHFISACQPTGKKIVEIGCGHGNLTYQYANEPSQIMGIDIAHTELILAKDNQPATAWSISFIHSKGEALPFPTQYFDIALFSSSL